jgi:hypothetical protein
VAGAEKAPATFSACEIIAAFATLLRITPPTTTLSAATLDDRKARLGKRGLKLIVIHEEARSEQFQRGDVTDARLLKA